MRDEAAVPGIGAQLDDFDLVGHVPALAQTVPVFQPGVRSQLLAQADDDHVAVFVGTGGQLALDLFQVERGDGMVEGDDLDQPLAERAVEEGIAAGAGDADVLAGQLHGFVVLDGEVVVVDAVDGEGS